MCHQGFMSWHLNFLMAFFSKFKLGLAWCIHSSRVGIWQGDMTCADM
ncbi:hypothetical protein GLYMA_10G287250v4 [Glycine max]|nr:hypothetical protein GLYMA_10G287250v4 [Glycine max]KAH1140568.1 hypothetical protein GYH30_029449 [Glycine max]